MEQALLFFKALGDETRLRLMLILMRYELNVNELVYILGMGQSRVSRHLKILTEAGLLQSRRDGLWVFYSSIGEGQGRKLLDSIYPFLTGSVQAEGDLALAAGVIDERVSRTRSFFNSIADDWDAMSREILGRFDLAAHVAQAVPKNCDTAVDLGCGTGVVLEKILEKAHQVIGVDGSARMLELARRRLEQAGASVSLRIGDLEHLPLRDAEASFACVNLVLHHLPHPRAVLQEASRILKQNGVLLVSEFDKHNDESMRAEYGDQWLGFDHEHLARMAADAGFTTVSTTVYQVGRGLSLRMFIGRKSS